MNHVSEAAVPSILPQYLNQNYLTLDPKPAQRKFNEQTMSSRLLQYQDYPIKNESNTIEARAQYAHKRRLQMKSMVFNPSDQTLELIKQKAKQRARQYSTLEQSYEDVH